MGTTHPDTLPLQEVTHLLSPFKKKPMQYIAFMAYFRVWDSPSFTKLSHCKNFTLDFQSYQLNPSSYYLQDVSCDLICKLAVSKSKRDLNADYSSCSSQVDNKT